MKYPTNVYTLYYSIYSKPAFGFPWRLLCCTKKTKQKKNRRIYVYSAGCVRKCIIYSACSRRKSAHIYWDCNMLKAKHISSRLHSNFIWEWINFFGTILIYYIIMCWLCITAYIWNAFIWRTHQTWLFCLYHFVVEKGKKWNGPACHSSHCCAEIFFNFHFSVCLVPV